MLLVTIAIKKAATYGSIEVRHGDSHSLIKRGQGVRIQAAKVSTMLTNQARTTSGLAKAKVRRTFRFEICRDNRTKARPAPSQAKAGMARDTTRARARTIRGAADGLTTATMG